MSKDKAFVPELWLAHILKVYENRPSWMPELQPPTRWQVVKCRVNEPFRRLKAAWRVLMGEDE